MATVSRNIHRKPSGEFARDFAIVGTVLQRPGQFFDEIRDGVDLPVKILALLISTITFLTIYGAILGSGHVLQAISSAIKLPIIFLGGLIACVPTLYIFDVLLGSKRSLSQTIAILLTSVTVIAVLLFGFAPITVVFRLTTNGFQFFKLLNVGFLIVAILTGLVYLERGLRQTSTSSSSHIWRELLYAFWVIVFILVISQMAWGLRPFFHYPGTPFTPFVDGGNIFTEAGSAIGEFMGFWVVR